MKGAAEVLPVHGQTTRSWAVTPSPPPAKRKKNGRLPEGWTFDISGSAVELGFTLARIRARTYVLYV